MRNSNDGRMRADGSVVSMFTVLVRGPFQYDADAVSDETGLRCEDESLTVQADRDDVDINFIVERFGIGNPAPPSYQPEN